MQSVLIEPVVKCGFEIDVVSEISRSRGGHKEVWFVGDGVIFVELFGCSFFVFADESEIEGVFYLSICLLENSPVACRNLYITNILLNK